jgi:predicted secreted protein
VPAGKQFRINLPEDHSTGYGWQLSQDYDTRLLRHISDVWHGNDKGIDFNFKALSAGQLTLTLVSRKYTDTAATKQFVVKILPN